MLIIEHIDQINIIKYKMQDTLNKTVNVVYNNNFILKKVGYFYNYIYSYNEYIKNKNVLEPSMLTNKAGIIYIYYKKTGKIKSEYEENITGVLYFDDYFDLITLIDSHITVKVNNWDLKDLKRLSIIIKIWEFKSIAKYRAKVAAQVVFDKKLIRFQKVINMLTAYKVRIGAGIQLPSKFLIEKVLTKELKPFIHIKIIDEEKQTECFDHLVKLILKKWPGVDAATFKFYLHKTIKLYQDNFEHDDAWDIPDTSEIKNLQYK